MNNRLPILWREPNGRGHYHPYWVNFCGTEPVLFTKDDLLRLEQDWHGKLNYYDTKDFVPHVEFASEEDKTVFVLRWT